jgi:superfamily II DNA or RNA helicase
MDALPHSLGTPCSNSHPDRRFPPSRLIGDSATFSGAIVFLSDGRAYSAGVDRGEAWRELSRMMQAATGRGFSLELGPAAVRRNNAQPQADHYLYLYRDRREFLRATRGATEFKEWRFRTTELAREAPLQLTLQGRLGGGASSSLPPVSTSALEGYPSRAEAAHPIVGRSTLQRAETFPRPFHEATGAARPDMGHGTGPRFEPGALVRLTERPDLVGRVVEGPFPTATGYDYKVLLRGQQNEQVYSEIALEAADPSAVVVVSRDRFLCQFLLSKLDNEISDLLYSFPASRTSFRVYQYKPVLKFLRSPDHRLLIADEVGLGKTIEAGMIFLELKARLKRMRTLVVCPSALREKWRLEMLNRFDEDFSILDPGKLQHFFDRYERYREETPLQGIISTETLRRYASELDERAIHFDLVIVDEAHHLRNPNTQSFALGEVLSSKTDAMIFLTATPLQLGNQDLFHLLHLLRREEFTDLWLFKQLIEPNQYITQAARLLRSGKIEQARTTLLGVEATSIGYQFRKNPIYTEVMDTLSRPSVSRSDIVRVQRSLQEINALNHIFTRTRKREVEESAVVRSATTITVDLTPSERAYYDSLLEQVRLLIRREKEWAQQMILVMRERQAASCLPASVEAFRKWLEQQRISLGLEGGMLSVEDEVVEGERDPNWSGNESLIRELLHLADRIGTTDTKFDRFLRTLEEALAETPESKVLVFSYFRGTLEYLERRLRVYGLAPLVIHGGISVPDRNRIIDQFRRLPSHRILLSSEVGAEGLDFEFCDVLCNYDLPWNPMRIEQRIGRLDRFGQKSPKIRIFNFAINDTVETRILQRLYERIRVFEMSIGDLEEILGEKLRELSRDVFRANLSPEEQVRRADEIAEVVERRRQDEETFEAEKGSLVGLDGLLEDEVRERLRTGNYISGEEVRALVETGLAEALGHLVWEDNHDGTYVVRPSAALRELVVAHSTEKGDDEVMQRFLSHFEPGRQSAWIPLTFDQERARERPNLEFITLRHPLARAVLERTRKAKTTGTVLTRIVAHAPIAEPRDAYFFLYVLSIEAVTPLRSLMAVVLDPASGDRLEQFETSLLNGLVTTAAECAQVGVDSARWLNLEQLARAVVAQRRDEEEAAERRRNEARLAARRASIEQFYLSKIDLAERRADEAANERIQRMKRAEAANLRERLQRELAELERRRVVVASYRLFGGGAVRFTAAVSPPRLPV